MGHQRSVDAVKLILMRAFLADLHLLRFLSRRRCRSQVTRTSGSSPAKAAFDQIHPLHLVSGVVDLVRTPMFGVRGCSDFLRYRPARILDSFHIVLGIASANSAIQLSYMPVLLPLVCHGIYHYLVRSQQISYISPIS